MPKNKNATKITPASIANALDRVLGKESVDKAAKQSRFLRRKRVLLPYALVLALISTLGMGKADWIADILRSYNGLVEGQFRYKPFHKRLAHSTFEIWMRRLLELALTHLVVPVLEPIAGDKLALFKDIIIHDGSSLAIKASLKKEFPGRFTKTSPAAVELHVSVSGFGEHPPRSLWQQTRRQNGTFELSHIALAAAYFSWTEDTKTRSISSRSRPHKDFSSFAAPRTSAPSLLRPATCMDGVSKSCKENTSHTGGCPVMTLTYKFEWANGKGAWWFCTGPVVATRNCTCIYTPIWVRNSPSPTLETCTDSAGRWNFCSRNGNPMPICTASTLGKRRLWKD